MNALRVGLTGGIGCGKSTVAAIFAELQVPVIDADDIARALVGPGTPAFGQIALIFGREIIVDGDIDRRALRRCVFADAAKRRALEDLLHPLVYREMDRRAKAFDAPYCILSIPLLLETAPPGFVDRVLVVDCSIENQMARTQARDRFPEDEIRRIIGTQIPRRDRLEAADDVIDNDDDPKFLRPRVMSLHTLYLRLARTAQPSTGRAEP